jgi:hypothetical protein
MRYKKAAIVVTLGFPALASYDRVTFTLSRRHDRVSSPQFCHGTSRMRLSAVRRCHHCKHVDNDIVFFLFLPRQPTTSTYSRVLNWQSQLGFPGCSSAVLTNISRTLIPATMHIAKHNQLNFGIADHLCAAQALPVRSFKLCLSSLSTLILRHA